MDRSFHPPNVSKLDFEFETWPHDALIEGFPSWIVTLPAMEKIEGARLSSVRFKEVKITTSEQFQDIYRNRRLPRFVWMDVKGRPGRDDFGINESFKITGSEQPIDARRFTLVISERALAILRDLGIANATIYKFDQ